MKKNETWFLVCFAVLAVLVFAASVVLKSRMAMAPDSSMSSDSAATPVPDSIATSSDANSGDGDEIVADATAGYYFSMPTNWYAEKNAGAGVTVYPDYDPKSGDAPECKIEISAFPKSSVDLNVWVTNDLHADPTASITEISRTSIAIASSSAIEWMGTLNGVTTTLVYAIEPDSKNILEIAPSTLSEASDADNDECDFDLQALLANLQFGAHEQ